MDWITRLAHQRDREKERTQQFDREIIELWESLKDRLKAYRDAYARLYPPGHADLEARYDGTTNPQAPVFTCMNRDGTGAFTIEKCRVALSQTGAVFKANYSTALPEILLTVINTEDGHAVVQHNSREISLDRVCELILRPMLFDDLPEES